MRLSHNLESLNVYRNILKSEKKQSKAMNRIESGSKLNSASDDPNRIAQCERFRLETRSLQSCSRNIQDTVSMIQTMDGGLSGMAESLQRIRELTIQAGGATNERDKAEIKNEINIMIEDFDYLAKSTEMNGVTLLYRDGMENKPEIVKSKISLEDDHIEIPTFNLTSDHLKIGKDKLKVENVEQLGESLKLIDDAIDKVTFARSTYGAIQNRLESSFTIVEDMAIAVTGADSLISDADVAEEMMNLCNSNILIEAGNAIMAQTNKIPMEVLNILRNVK